MAHMTPPTDQAAEEPDDDDNRPSIFEGMPTAFFERQGKRFERVDIERVTVDGQDITHTVNHVAFQPAAPPENAGVVWDLPAELFFGTEVISSMTQAAMVEEMLRYHRKSYMRLDQHEMRTTLANARLMRYRERLAAECGVDPHSGMWPFG